MKTLIVLSSIIILFVGLNACQNGQTAEKQSDTNQVLNPNDSLFIINEGGFSFGIVLPKDLMIANTPVVKFNGATGDMHIQCGDEFWIVASMENTDMNKIKSQLGDDILFTSKIIEETSNSLLYQRNLPDGSEYDYNYRSICQLGDKKYTFRTCEEGEFSLGSVNRMKSAISSVYQSI